MTTNDMEKCCVDGILMYDEKGKAIFPAKMICTKCSPAMEAQGKTPEHIAKANGGLKYHATPAPSDEEITKK